MHSRSVGQRQPLCDQGEATWDSQEPEKLLESNRKLETQHLKPHNRYIEHEKLDQNLFGSILCHHHPEANIPVSVEHDLRVQPVLRNKESAILELVLES